MEISFNAESKMKKMSFVAFGLDYSDFSLYNINCNLLIHIYVANQLHVRLIERLSILSHSSGEW